ncbi:MAG: methenyltetrahydromethanopterin cyclohydrolase [Candidatus Eutrophobiaceae bacterium]
MKENWKNTPSVQALAQPLLSKLIANADRLGLIVTQLDNGTRLVDAGMRVQGSVEAGVLISEICMGGLGQVHMESSDVWPCTESQLTVSTDQPVLSCLASQYAGWSLKHGEGKEAFQALGSGPARALGSNEELFAELGYRDQSESAVLVMETDKAPPLPLVDKIAQRCGVQARELTLIIMPITSLCGVIQVAARVVETALHKMHSLHLPLDRIISGSGRVPLCPVTEDFMIGMGRSNDAILFGGEVDLTLDASDEELEEWVQKMPSSASPDYGQLFSEIFKAVNYDFYQIDPLLFSPALVHLTSSGSGKVFSAGQLNRELLEKSFSG